MIQIKIRYQQNKILGLSIQPESEASANWSNPNSTTNLLFDRGYTGHQMLDEFDIIDMNGRIYDPIIARFFSPDPYVQTPTNTQSFNRYSYVVNNPLIYTDPSGNFGGLDAWLVGFVKGFFSTGSNRWSAGLVEGDKRANNDWKLINGLFTYDTHYSGKGDFWRDTWQVVSRLTWEGLQTTVGLTFSQAANYFGGVNEVDYFRGRTVVNTTFGGGGMTLSSYIMGENLKPNFRDHLFVHEFGHTIQSKRWGPLYMPIIAIPSGFSAALSDDLNEQHNLRWYEAQASRYGGEYFDEYYGSGAEGYIENNRNYFDINSYENEGVKSPYVNPRNNGNNFFGHPLHGTKQWNDIVMYLYLFPLPNSI